MEMGIVRSSTLHFYLRGYYLPIYLVRKGNSMMRGGWLRVISEEGSLTMLADGPALLTWYHSPFSAPTAG